MNRQSFKIARKLEVLINFCIHYKHNYRRNYKHNNQRKLRIHHIRFNTNLIKLYFGSKLLFTVCTDEEYCMNNPEIYFFNGKIKTESRYYDEDELFALSTVYPTLVTDFLRIQNIIRNEYKIISVSNIDYDLVCDACNSISTQYKKI